jgi:pantetheine-phosphate adenylyltransferase
MNRVERASGTALFPASFDPITNGHLDIIQRSLRLFDHLVIAVAVNVAKGGLFSVEERIEMLREVMASEPRVSVHSFSGLTVDYARQIGAGAVIRGVRAMSDFEYEFEMALMNKHLSPDLETVFLMASQEYLYVSSSRLKELARFGRSVDEFVPPEIAVRLEKRLAQGR